MPLKLNNIRSHSAASIASISSTFISFCLPSTTRTFSAARPLRSVVAATRAMARSPTPMKVVKRQIKAVTARTYSYSGMFFTSFLLASFLPFQIAPAGKSGRGGKRGDKGGKRERGRNGEGQDPDRHDMDNKTSCTPHLTFIIPAKRSRR